MNKISKIYKCECWSEAIETSLNEDGQIEICMWQQGFSPRNTGIKEKLRWIWYILTHNNFWSDECILSKETALQLAYDIHQEYTKLDYSKCPNIEKNYCKLYNKDCYYQLCSAWRPS